MPKIRNKIFRCFARNPPTDFLLVKSLYSVQFLQSTYNFFNKLWWTKVVTRHEPSDTRITIWISRCRRYCCRQRKLFFFFWLENFFCVWFFLKVNLNPVNKKNHLLPILCNARIVITWFLAFFCFRLLTPVLAIVAIWAET